MLKLIIENESVSTMDLTYGRYLLPTLVYEKEYWKKGRHKKERCTYNKPFIITKSGGQILFYTGLIPRLVKYAKNHDIDIIVEQTKHRYDKILNPIKPNIKGITFRNYQKPLIKRGITQQRGVIVSPTGTGKTIMQLGIISAFPHCRTLILAHTVDLVKQTVEEIKKYKVGEVSMMGGGKQNASIPLTKIVVSTIQTFKKFINDPQIHNFHMLIVDECHHIKEEKGMYAQLINKMTHCSIRLGFTATPRKEKESILVSEGILGPVVAQYRIKKATQQEVLAKPRIKIIKVPVNHSIKNIKGYNQIYDRGVVNNSRKNNLLVKQIKLYIKQKKSCLTMIHKIEHGELLLKLLNEASIKTVLVNGSTPAEERSKTKKDLMGKKLLSVITSVVWKEGINIPTLDVIVNAGGGKSDLVTMQSIGRGLRRTTTKEEVIIVDFFDSSHAHLINHFGERFSLYCDMGWI